METLNNNFVKMGGITCGDIEFSHEVYDEKFYKFYIEIERLSDLKDRLPVIISERLINIDEYQSGKLVYLEGQFRSYNQTIEGRNKLMLTMFIKSITTEDVDDNIKTLNEANIVGYICKQPIYRKTPLGREIADVLIAVNRTYKKSDYIPCILWGRNAKFCETLGVGAKVKVSGRIQARKYEKKYEDGTVKEMVAYELSAAKFGLVSEDDEESVTSQDID